MDKRQLHGSQPALDVDFKAPSEADLLLSLGSGRVRGEGEHALYAALQTDEVLLAGGGL